MPHASGNSPVPTSSSQISETESLDVLELAPKFSKLSGERPSGFIPLPAQGSQGHQNIPLQETQPKLTTAQAKISSVAPEIIPYQEIEIFENGKSKGVTKKLYKVEGRH